MISTILAAFVQVGVKEWMFNNIKDICQPTQAYHMTCPHNAAFYTSSAVYGLIGPARQFGAKSLYHPMLYALIVGALLPIPFFFIQRRWPKSIWRYVNMPLLLNGVMYIPPATGINYSSWIAVGFLFQFVIRRRHFAWWSRFNYVTSAALDSGMCSPLFYRCLNREANMRLCRHGGLAHRDIPGP
jgi:OPT family oligopeptide transporter